MHGIVSYVRFKDNLAGIYAVKPKRHWLRCHRFRGSRVTTAHVYTNVVDREWNWQRNWQSVNQHSWDPWPWTTWSRRVTSDFNSVWGVRRMLFFTRQGLHYRGWRNAVMLRQPEKSLSGCVCVCAWGGGGGGGGGGDSDTVCLQWKSCVSISYIRDHRNVLVHDRPLWQASKKKVITVLTFLFFHWPKYGVGHPPPPTPPCARDWAKVLIQVGSRDLLKRGLD